MLYTMVVVDYCVGWLLKVKCVFSCLGHHCYCVLLLFRAFSGHQNHQSTFKVHHLIDNNEIHHITTVDCCLVWFWKSKLLCLMPPWCGRVSSFRNSTDTYNTGFNWILRELHRWLVMFKQGLDFRVTRPECECHLLLRLRQKFYVKTDP